MSLHFKNAKISLDLTQYPLLTRPARAAVHSWDEVGACGASCGATIFTVQHAAHATRGTSHTAISHLAISMYGTFHTPLRMLWRRPKLCCSYLLLFTLPRPI